MDKYSKYIGQKVSTIGRDVDKNDLVYKAIESQAASDELITRWLLPLIAGTMDLNPNRLNIYLNSSGSITRIFLG